MQNFKKINEWSLEIFKDGRTNQQRDQQGRLLWTHRVNPGPKLERSLEPSWRIAKNLKKMKLDSPKSRIKIS